MILRQIFEPQLGRYAYLIGCQKTGDALVVDPLRDVDTYWAIAEAEGMQISAVAETHVHSDFISGAAELANDERVTLYLSAEGGSNWQGEWATGKPNLRRLRHGDRFMVGRLEIQALHTPGHTAEHLCFLVTDGAEGADEPLALLTGEALLVGEIGRPDPTEPGAARTTAHVAAAKSLRASLRQLSALPEYLQVLPGRAASAVGTKRAGAIPTSTIGYEKRFNQPLRLALSDCERTFVDFAAEAQPEAPHYFAGIRQLNLQGAPLLGDQAGWEELELEAVTSRLRERNFVVLDTRSDREAFVRSHLRGSLYAPSNGEFLSFAAAYLDPREEIVLVVESVADVSRMARQLTRVGFDRIAGWLPASALAGAASRHLQSIPTLKFYDLERRMASHPASLVLDVRRAADYALTHLQGSIHIAYHRLRAQVRELKGDGPVYVHCQGGTRASAAVAFLQRTGKQVFYVNDTFKNAPASLLA